ncbi:hypothetical protein DR950_31880 [Kitasatospora xanthocidica]|uniref:DUF262 domain-containing protein n=1 Tax=Kitasatospora xanthocidica TaxID=83382 RepID=A0A373A1S9_9ACTN|nr:hypothetical protein [Kitasatospora xanthocidica]RGD61734.1 hypothetical protein DR950_31880 [Kitasatospora xanthocidica]
MNNNRVPLGPWLGISWGADTPPALDRHILRARHVVAIGNRWMCLIEAAELAALADMPDAAFVLGSRRGYLSDSQVNQAFANALRERPEDVGFFGAPIVLSSRSPHWEPGWGGGSGLLGFAGVQCFDGFQRLVTMAHLARELPPGHLSRALLWVVVVTGEDVDRGRELCDEVAHHINRLEPQDNLVRCPDLLRVQAEFRQEGGFFDPRRGIVSGPHPVGFTPADVFRSLAALSLAPRPHLSNQLQTVEGLNGLWSDITGPAYRSLVHEGLHAISIQRAVEARGETQKVIARMLKRNSKGCWKLLEYAPELVTWTACRALPLETLHDGSRTSPNWTKLINGGLAAETERIAHLLVASYERLRGSEHKFKLVAHKLDLWLELADMVLGKA